MNLRVKARAPLPFPGWAACSPFRLRYLGGTGKGAGDLGGGVLASAP